MKLLIFLCALFFYDQTLAETISDEVYSIKNGLIKFKNGRVAFISPKNLFHLRPGDTIDAIIDENLEVKSLKNRIKSPQYTLKESNYLRDIPSVFEPTVMANLDKAIEIFNNSNRNYKRISECTHRAHVWAHDEFRRSNIKSMKAFVFFTDSYIKSVRFKWWFHVAPMYLVNVNGSVQSLIMDFRYSDGPQNMKTWTDKFVYTKRECKLTNKFSEYDVNPQTENCYLMIESMHYLHPLELMNQETLGQYKTSTSEAELKLALNYAFHK